MGTFHQYANQILRNGGAAALGFTPDYTVWDQQRAVETLDLTLSPRQRDLLASLRWYALNRGQWPDSPEIDARESHWRDVVAAYTGEKQWQNALDLDDLPALNAKARLPHVDGLLERRAAGPPGTETGGKRSRFDGGRIRPTDAAAAAGCRRIGAAGKTRGAVPSSTICWSGSEGVVHSTDAPAAKAPSTSRKPRRPAMTRKRIIIDGEAPIPDYLVECLEDLVL